jgi:membrane-associated protease RseP (regulator of RpoE activity)
VSSPVASPSPRSTIFRFFALAVLVGFVAPATLGSSCDVATGWGGGMNMGESWPGGIGAILGHSSAEHRLVIREVPEVGLQPGDEIVKIDGHSVAEMELDTIVAALRGEVGSKVLLLVRRGDEEFAIEVLRAPYRED